MGAEGFWTLPPLLLDAVPLLPLCCAGAAAEAATLGVPGGAGRKRHILVADAPRGGR